MIPIRVKHLPQELEAPFSELFPVLQLERYETAALPAVSFFEKPGGICLEHRAQGWFISYEHRCEAMRALGLWVQHRQQPEGFVLRETSAFALGAMIDCSRNGVLRAEACRRLLRHLALMGYSQLQLYTEDTYEIPGHPYFGYLRGAYTGEELRLLDAYAGQLGIELVPCIQTLAHLENALRWKEYGALLDVGDILLVGCEKTYELIDAMFASLSECLSSRKINIGMDEAALLGCGHYLDTHPHTDRAALMLEHLSKVCGIARKYGYQPMMWSDMFFRLSSQEYYGSDADVPQAVADGVPPDVSLIYWNYYDTQEDVYRTVLKKHRAISDKIVYAAGAWRWHGFTPGNAFSMEAGRAALPALQENGVREVIVTCWGDNGAEGSVFSLLPTFQFWAENSCSPCGGADLPKRFSVCTGADWDAFLTLDLPLFTGDNPYPGKCGYSPAKVMLYSDLLTGMFDTKIDANAASLHFDRAQRLLCAAKAKCGCWAYLFETQEKLCRLLVQKSPAGQRIRRAYKQKDKEVLLCYAREILPQLCRDIEAFQRVYEVQWETENKYVGRDVFDLRIGGQKERILSAIRALTRFLEDGVSIEELEQPLLDFKLEQFHTAHDLAMLSWHQIATPSNLF